jgi:hypothetical protein
LDDIAERNDRDIAFRNIQATDIGNLGGVVRAGGSVDLESDNDQKMAVKLGLVLVLIPALISSFTVVRDGHYLAHPALNDHPLTPTARGMPVEISINAATYGGNCGAPHGNATNDVTLICDGETDCAYTVDVRNLGDPAPKCSKTFSVSYSCLPDPKVLHEELSAEAGLGSVLDLRCAPPRSELAEAESPWRREIPKQIAPPRSGLYIRSATYGANCTVPEGNATKDLVASCNGKVDCAYSVKVEHLGDPAPKCGKNFSVSYSCMPDTVILHQDLPAEAGFGSILKLSCASARPTSSKQ